MVSVLAPLARTPCQIRPGPRCRTACVAVLRLAVRTSPMAPCATRSREEDRGVTARLQPDDRPEAALPGEAGISFASPSVRPRGHSQTTALPASSPAITRSR
jgi:hypothetical protein